jgi:hypothetical protein
VRAWRSTGIFITITRSDRIRLEAITGGCNAPQQRAWRVAIVVLSADGVGCCHAADLQIQDLCVRRGQKSFVRESVDRLQRDKTLPLAYPRRSAKAGQVAAAQSRSVLRDDRATPAIIHASANDIAGEVCAYIRPD